MQCQPGHIAVQESNRSTVLQCARVPVSKMHLLGYKVSYRCYDVEHICEIDVQDSLVIKV